MSTIYLCIGTMKTGTTALQNFMRNNPEALQKQGFCYPFTNVGSIRSIKNRNAHFMIHKPEHENDIVQQKGYQKLQKLAKTYPNIVLSEELVWHHSKKIKDFWPDVLEKLSAIDCQLKVIVYLRRQDELIQSLWNQGVKTGWRISLRFEDYVRLGKYNYFPLDYYGHLKEIEEAIGKENLIVRVYENGQFEGEEHTIISDLLHVLGIQMTDDFVFENEIRNPSLSGNFIEIKRILNGLPDYKEMDDFMKKAVISASVSQSKDRPMPKQSLFSYEDQLAFLERYAEGNRKVAEEYLGREDGILFRKPVVEMPLYQVDPETMFQDLLAFTAEMFCQQQKKIDKLEAKLDKHLSTCFMRLCKKIKKRLKCIFRPKNKKEMV